MSLDADLAAMYADTFLTVEVRSGSERARGFFDRSPLVGDAAGLEVRAGGAGVRLLADALSADALATGAKLVVAGTSYLVQDVVPIEDGREVLVLLSGRPS